MVMLGAKKEQRGQWSRADEKGKADLERWGEKKEKAEAGHRFFLKSLKLTLAEDKTERPLQDAYAVERE